jgi:copper chaperone CopZ
MYSLLAGFMMACAGDVNTSTTEELADAGPAKAKFEIKGMVCATGCAKSIEAKLSETDGVLACSVNFGKEEAEVEFDPRTISQSEVIALVEEMHDGQFEVVEVEEIDEEEKVSAGASDDDEALFEVPEVKFPNIFDIIGNFYAY